MMFTKWLLPNTSLLYQGLYEKLVRNGFFTKRRRQPFKHTKGYSLIGTIEEMRAMCYITQRQRLPGGEEESFKEIWKMKLFEAGFQCQ